MFGLGKISLVIGLRVKGKMKRNIEWLFKVFCLGDELNGLIKSQVWDAETMFANEVYVEH
jgi:hypothetical protein